MVPIVKILGAAPPAAPEGPPVAWGEARSRYPALARIGEGAISFTQSAPARNKIARFSMLRDFANPLSPDTPSIELFGTGQTADDLAAIVISRYLAQGADPYLTKALDQFRDGLAGGQRQRLRALHEQARKDGDWRDFDSWYEEEGLPRLFSDYLVGKVSMNEAYDLYSPDQISAFDGVARYLKTGSAPTKQNLHDTIAYIAPPVGAVEQSATGPVGYSDAVREGL